MTLSRYFEGAGERPQRIHILRGGGRGREILDLRKDTERAFLRVDQEFLGADGYGRWKDQQGDFDEGSGVAALTIEGYRDTPKKMPHVTHNQNDELHLKYQMQHDWYVETAVKPHIHLIPLADPASDQVIVFDGYYVWSQYGVELPALAGWTSFKVEHTVSNGDVFIPTVCPIGTIPSAVGANVSNFFHLYLRRPGMADGDDTYSTNKVGGTVTANVAIEDVDLHYYARQLGTLDEF